MSIISVIRNGIRHLDLEKPQMFGHATHDETLKRQSEDRIHRPHRAPNCQTIRLATIDEVEKEWARMVESREILKQILDTSKMETAVVVQGDTVSVDTETTGADIYVRYASKRFGVPEEHVTPAMRRAAKTAMFNVIYGGS